MKNILKFKQLNESKGNKEFYSKSDSVSHYIEIPNGNYKDVEIGELIGKYVMDLVWTEAKMILECINEKTNSAEYYIFMHDQDCCEQVWLDDIVGDLNDLIGTTILKAEQKISYDDDDESPINGSADDSHTWTFYTLATSKGYVDFRWYGTSNGYYSESINIYKVIPE